MANYTLPITISANSKQEAEQKLLMFQKIASEHKKFTLNDAFGGIVTVCSEINDFLNKCKKINEVPVKLQPENPKNRFEGLQFFSSLDDTSKKEEKIAR